MALRSACKLRVCEDVSRPMVGSMGTLWKCTQTLVPCDDKGGVRGDQCKGKDRIIYGQLSVPRAVSRVTRCSVLCGCVCNGDKEIRTQTYDLEEMST